MAAMIEAGRVGRDQAAPGREFDGDASRPARGTGEATSHDD